MDFELDYSRKSIPQGDVYLIPIKKIPSEFIHKPIEAENGHYIITHSETGHHHVVLEKPEVKMFSGMEIFRDFLRVANEPVDLVHLRESHTHETQIIEPGDWLIQRQAAYSPQGWKRAID